MGLAATGGTSVDLHVLSAGAAQGLVNALQEEFRAATGANLTATFGAVGAIKEKLAAGEPCDVVILTAAMIAEMEADGRVVAGTSVQLGRVRTGIAVREGEPVPAIADGVALRDTLLAATGIYFPDPERATAGIHFVKVLTKLGIHDVVAPRFMPFPNGATAMRALAQATEPGIVGCTQITEIRYTRGVVLVGPLPADFELATVYTAGVCASATEPECARRFVATLTGKSAHALRAAGGFE